MKRIIGWLMVSIPFLAVLIFGSLAMGIGLLKVLVAVGAAIVVTAWLLIGFGLISGDYD